MGWMRAICDAHNKKVGVEKLYNWVHKKFNQLKTRCGRESQHPAEGALRPSINQFGDQTSWRPDQLEIRCGRENQHPERLGPHTPAWAAQENGKKTLMAIRVGGKYVAVLFVSNSLSHKTLSIKLYFLKTVSLVFKSLWFCMHVHMSIQPYFIVYLFLTPLSISQYKLAKNQIDLLSKTKES